ncbi:hypothetical protein DFH06DRAFT_1147988 [Mycena polygramma]|nr:hypothetical protein DFH06DRAFT_1147988 [Mycena polygramma]
MFAKYISSALLFLVFAQGTLAVVCGNPPLPACPPPCILTRLEQAPPRNIAASLSGALGQQASCQQVHESQLELGPELSRKLSFAGLLPLVLYHHHQFSHRTAHSSIVSQQMHAGLEIPEIVDLIVSALDTDCETPDLAALSRTSIIFSEPALDVLWKKQGSIMNLIRCFPADLWESRAEMPDGSWSVPREFVPSDWERVSKYAPRVKELSCDDTPDLRFLSTVYGMFGRGVPGGYLLPNLEHLSWHHYDPAYSVFMNLFLGPRIKSISIGRLDDGRCPALATLAHTHPELVSLETEAVNGDSEPAERNQLYNCVRALKHLEFLDVRTLDSGSLIHLGAVPTLKTLRAILPNSLALPGVPDSSMFLQLRAFSSRPEQDQGGGILPLLALMCTWARPQLTTFEADIFECRGLADIDALYKSLANHCSHGHLRMLQLEFMESDPPALPAHPGSLLSAPLCFTRLTVVEIQVPAGYDIEDATVAEIARAWSAIEELGLRSRVTHEPRCTLLSLASFARHCPQLWLLSITVDASEVPRAPFAAGLAEPQDKLKFLDVGSSPISSVGAIISAAFLSSIFTGLTQITADRGWNVGDVHYKQWMRVQRLIPGLVDRRKREVGSG